MVAVPLFPRVSVTVQVWFPESMECSDGLFSVWVLPASMKQLPVQVEVHVYVNVGLKFPEAVQVKLREDEACCETPGGRVVIATAICPKSHKPSLNRGSKNKLYTY